MLDPRRLRTVRQFADEHPAFSPRALRHLIFRANTNGFEECLVRVGGRIYIDLEAFTAWLTKQQAQPKPHQRGIARKRLALTRHQHDLTV